MERPVARYHQNRALSSKPWLQGWIQWSPALPACQQLVRLRAINFHLRSSSSSSSWPEAACTQRQAELLICQSSRNGGGSDYTQSESMAKATLVHLNYTHTYTDWSALVISVLKLHLQLHSLAACQQANTLKNPQQTKRPEKDVSVISISIGAQVEWRAGNCNGPVILLHPTNQLVNSSQNKNKKNIIISRWPCLVHFKMEDCRTVCHPVTRKQVLIKLN